VLNFSAVASDIGVSVPTVKRWLSVLEASFLIYLLPPYYQNFGKRIIKAPKLYFTDVGLLTYLLNLKEENILINGPMAGAVFETMIISEIWKRKSASGIIPELYYWRSQNGVEIDLLLPCKGTVIPCEIKLSSALKPAFYKNILYFLTLSGNQHGEGRLYTNCAAPMPLPENIKNIFWQEI